jgi:hypothetical protein
MMLLNVKVQSDVFPRFAQILGHGFRMRTCGGGSIRDVLCRQFGVSDAYLDDRVQTVFLNGKAVDNVDSAIIADGTVLSLSAAMPGLVGATFRKGGFYAALRENISYGGGSGTECQTEGLFTLKLFNMVAKELGPLFLEAGIVVSGKELAQFLDRTDDQFRKGWKAAELDGKPVDPDKLPALLNGTGGVVLSVTEG